MVVLKKKTVLVISWGAYVMKDLLGSGVDVSKRTRSITEDI